MFLYAGIGIPMMAANYISGITVTLQSENGILGLVRLFFWMLGKIIFLNVWWSNFESFWATYLIKILANVSIAFIAQKYLTQL